MTDQPQLLARIAEAPSLRAYLAQTSAEADSAGFTAANSLTVLSKCRDSLCQHVTASVQELRGNPFDISGLGGVPGLGPVGWSAAISQCPDPANPRLVKYVFTHIGVGTHEDGSNRVGLIDTAVGHPPRAVCGAFGTAHKLLSAEPAASSLVPRQDPEFARVWDLVGHVTHKDFGEFTLAASELVAADAWSRIQETAANQATPPRIAFFAALQVHTPDGDLAIPISHHLG